MTRDTEDVVERLRRRTVPVMGGAGLYEVVLDERPDTLCAKAADLIQSLSDRIDVLEEERQRISQWCDERFSCGSTEALDHISAILRASLTQGGKNVS